jgi:hypothetical protein
MVSLGQMINALSRKQWIRTPGKTWGLTPKIEQ